MRRRGSMLALALLLHSAAPVPAAAAAADALVVPGYELQFPRDFGSHASFGIEWWYVTGWLTTAAHEPLGFQITFFRTRSDQAEANPSAFAPRELLIAHCALSDPAHARFWHDQRVRRAGLGLAQAEQADTRVWIDDWRLERQPEGYRLRADAESFALELTLSPTQAPLREGEAGFSQKGPTPSAASYYYSEPHLRVGGRVARAAQSTAVSGEAWLDHEWSSAYLDPNAAGWDWIGLNLADGGALMAFRMRDRQGQPYWSAATVRDAAGAVRTLRNEAVEFTPRRYWRSPHSGASYPVSFDVRVGERQFRLEPLLDDQENDARLSSGAIYWEGAVTASEPSADGRPRPVSRGYLELTGYERPLALR